ncbi:hypothetical protein Tco_0717431 [Tanacetum coccineum]
MPNTPLQESPSVVIDSDEEKILNDLQKVFPTSPTQVTKTTDCFRRRFRHIHVIEKITELMSQISFSMQQGKGVSFSFPSRASKNQQFKDDQIKLKQGNDVERKSLRIAASEKGLYVRGLVFSQGMTTINCANMGTRGVSIPSDAHKMSSIDTAIDRRISEGRLVGRMAF